MFVQGPDTAYYRGKKTIHRTTGCDRRLQTKKNLVKVLPFLLGLWYFFHPWGNQFPRSLHAKRQEDIPLKLWKLDFFNQLNNGNKFYALFLGKNPCNSSTNGGCSDLCLLNTRDKSCACPTGVKLLPDRKTCEQGKRRKVWKRFLGYMHLICVYVNLHSSAWCFLLRSTTRIIEF